MNMPCWWYDNPDRPGVWRLAVSAVLIAIIVVTYNANEKAKRTCDAQKRERIAFIEACQADDDCVVYEFESRRLIELRQICEVTP